MTIAFNPPSWAARDGVPATVLSDFVNVISPENLPVVNGQPVKLYFEECVADQGGQRDHRLAANQGSGSTMHFWLEDHAMTRVEIQKVVSKSILGGYWGEAFGGNNKKNPPMPQPIVNNSQVLNLGTALSECKGMFATNIMSWKSCSPREWIGPPGTALTAGGDPESMKRSAAYNTSMLGITFESLPYSVNNSPVDGVNFNWISTEVRATNARVSLPLGTYVYVGFPRFPALLGQWKVLPQSYVSMTVHQVPRSAYFGNNTNQVPLPLFAEACGKVNNAPFAGCTTGTLLLNDMVTLEYTDWLGQRMIELKLNLIYNAIGWNNQFFPGGGIAAIREAQPPGNPPFLPMNIQAIIAAVNPI